MEGATSDRLFSVNVPRVRESLNALADDVEYITTGNADNPSDGDAWERRTNAGVQLVRLRAALNNGELDRADCALPTLELLRRIWHAIQALEYGSHHDQPDQYCGPLYLPGEIKPLFPLSRESLHVRKADEPYDPYPELTAYAPSKDAMAEAVAELEQKATGGSDGVRTNDLAIRALRSLNKSALTTKRERWADVPSDLRALSAKLAVTNEFIAAQFSGISPTLDAVANRIFNPDQYCPVRSRTGVTG